MLLKRFWCFLTRVALKLINKLSEIKVGDFIKFTEKDKSGKFHHVGQVLTINETDKNFVMEAFEGTMGFTICKENELHIVEKPVGWDKFIKDPFKFRKNVKNKETLKDIAPVVKTQKELVFDLVKENKKLTKAKLLKLLVKTYPNASDVMLKNHMELALMKLG